MTLKITSESRCLGYNQSPLQIGKPAYRCPVRGERDLMNEPLAVIGIGCRFPGSANSPQEFWDMLCAGTDAIREIPPNRWSIPAHYDPVPGRDGKSVSRWGGFVDNIDLFDPGFFGISAREADAIDPQQRLLLEVSWEAIEDAGLLFENIRGSSTGVFVGISTSDYGVLQNEGGGRTMADVYSATGSTFSISANRISYCFDLHGPSLAIDTACSSALTACHVACESVWRGDCSMAIVGGVNALLSQSTFFAFSRMSMLSPDGRSISKNQIQASTSRSSTSALSTDCNPSHATLILCLQASTIWVRRSKRARHS